MFKNEFQGGPFVELFSVQGKDPLSKVKTSGSHTSLRKEFNPELRTFVLSLDGEPSTTKLLFPKNSKQSLHIIQPYLVFQIYIQTGRSFSLEVSLTDHKNLKQRLIFSNSNREVVVTALHVKMPCSVITSNTWLNLCLDLNGLLASTYNKFSVLDSFVVSANCTLRRVFSLKSRPESNSDIPRNVYLGDVPTVLQLLDLDSFLDAGINVREGTGKKLQRSNNTLSTSSERSHIAFGSRTLIRRNSTPREELSSSRPDKSSRYFKKETDLNNNNSTVPTQNDDAEKSNVLRSSKATIVPRPPKQSSGLVRKPRIKSADYSKLSNSQIERAGQLSKSADTKGRKLALSGRRDEPLKALPLNTRNKVTDEKVEILRPLQVKKKLSKSSFELDTCDLPRFDNGKVFSRDCRSKSLTVLPNIKRSPTSTPEPLITENVVSSLDDNVFVNSSQETDTSLVMGDDVMIEEYLLRRTSSNCTHDDSLSSSCTASMNSDLYLYSSRPKSVSSQPFTHSNTDSLHLESYEEALRNGIDAMSTGNPESEKPFGEQQLSSGIGSSISLNDEDELKRTKDENNVFIESPISFSSPNSSVLIASKPDNNERNTTISNNNISESTSEKSFENTSVNTSDGNVTYTESNETSRNEENNNKNKTNELCQIAVEETADESNSESANKTYNVEDNNEENNLPIFHQYRPADSLEADSMSWLRTSNEYSETSEKIDSLNVNDINNNNNIEGKKPATKSTPLRQRLLEQLGSMIVQSKDIDTDDGFSDCSDDTTVADPPPKFNNYRYQDEMKSLSSTIDLSATIPATPQVGEQAKANNADVNNNGGRHPLRQSKDEELLDLLFDPVLNCYYDPKTEKYYELS